MQIGRAREKQWTARVEKRFLSALASTCNVKAACAEVGMGVVSAYNHRRRWPLFASAWAKAEETGFLRLEAALVAAAAGIGEEPEFEPDIPIEGMTVWHAMQLARAATTDTVMLVNLSGRGDKDVQSVTEALK